MMKLVRITKSDDNYLERLVPLYKEAFPVEERRDIEQLKHLIDKQPEMYFNAIECDGQLAGFFCLLELEGFLLSGTPGRFLRNAEFEGGATSVGLYRRTFNRITVT